MSELVQDVAERLNIPEEEADLVLRALSKLILKQTGRSDAARVPEVGVFRREDGRLTFTPDEQLAAVVNHRFEGLPPLPAIEEDPEEATAGEPEAAAPPLEEPAEDAGEVPSDAAQESIEEEPPPAAPESADLPDGQDVLAQSVSEVLEAGEEPSSTKPSEEPSSKEEPSAEEPPAEPSLPASVPPPSETAEAEAPDGEPVVAEPAEAPSEDAPAPAKSGDRSPARARRPRRSRSSWSVVGLLLVGLLLGGGIWLVTADQAPEESAEVTNPSEESLEEAQPLMSEGSADEPSEDEPGGAEEDDASAEDEASSEELQAEIDVTADGYTLVIISRRDRSTLENMLESYRETFVPMGYPASVLAPPAGETRYRLGLGQFDDPDEALEAREALEDQIPGDSWVLRLHPEMDPDS